MKLFELYNGLPKSGHNDPLMALCASWESEQTKLKGLRAGTAAMLIPATVKGKGFVAAIDPDCQAEAESLAAKIEGTKGAIRELEGRIDKVDEIASRYGIQRPLLREMQRDIGSMKHSIEGAKVKVPATLGHVLSFKACDEAAAKEHPDYLKVVKEYETRKATLEPKIEALEKAAKEIAEVLNGLNPVPA